MDFARTVEEHLKMRAAAEGFKEKQEKYRDFLKAEMHRLMEPDENGHRWWFPEEDDPVTDPEGVLVESVQLQRRATRSLVPSFVDDLMEARPELVEKVYSTELSVSMKGPADSPIVAKISEALQPFADVIDIRLDEFVDEDAILSLNFTEDISDKELKTLYQVSETFAFKVNKEK